MNQFITFLIVGLAGALFGSYLSMRRRRAIHGAAKKRQTERDANINKLKVFNR